MHAGGNEIDVLDIHGRPHMESCDPGIFPSFFYDYSRPAGREAYLSVIERLVVNGSADGVYSDCYSESGCVYAQVSHRARALAAPMASRTIEDMHETN